MAMIQPERGNLVNALFAFLEGYWSNGQDQFIKGHGESFGYENIGFFFSSLSEQTLICNLSLSSLCYGSSAEDPRVPMRTPEGFPLIISLLSPAWRSVFCNQKRKVDMRKLCWGKREGRRRYNQEKEDDGLSQRKKWDRDSLNEEDKQTRKISTNI